MSVILVFRKPCSRKSLRAASLSATPVSAAFTFRVLDTAPILNITSLNSNSVNGDSVMKVVVIGGGVAGSACAAALARGGADVTVYEAHPDPAGPVGSFLSLAANGLRGLEALGCMDRVQAAGFAVPWQQMRAGRGKSL